MEKPWGKSIEDVGKNQPKAQRKKIMTSRGRKRNLV